MSSENINQTGDSFNNNKNLNQVNFEIRDKFEAKPVDLAPTILNASTISFDLKNYNSKEVKTRYDNDSAFERNVRIFFRHLILNIKNHYRIFIFSLRRKLNQNFQDALKIFY